MEDYKHTGTDDYERIYTQNLLANYNTHLLNLVKKHLPTQGEVLDFGAGLGYFALQINMGGGIHTHCLEADTSQLTYLKEQGFNTFKDTGDVGRNSMDYIYSINVIEHIEDDLDTLKQLKLILKPNCKMFIYVPAFNSLWSDHDTFAEHFRRYTKKTLSQVCIDAGFKIIECRYCDSLGFFITLLYKFISLFKNKDKHNGELDSPASLRLFDLIFPISKALDKVFNKLFGKNVWIVVQN